MKGKGEGEGRRRKVKTWRKSEGEVAMHYLLELFFLHKGLASHSGPWPIHQSTHHLALVFFFLFLARCLVLFALAQICPERTAQLPLLLPLPRVLFCIVFRFRHVGWGASLSPSSLPPWNGVFCPFYFFPWRPRYLLQLTLCPSPFSASSLFPLPMIFTLLRSLPSLSFHLALCSLSPSLCPDLFIS